VLCAVTIPPVDCKSAGGIVRPQSPAEDPLKMVVKKTETCRGFILSNTFLTFY